MNRHFLYRAVVLVFLVAYAAFAQELMPVEPAEQEVVRQRKTWFFQQRAYPLGPI
jgi:hypothetical protein